MSNKTKPAAKGSSKSAAKGSVKTDVKPLLRWTPMPALEQAAECLKALAHPHRLRMVQMLLRGEYTVGELAEACELPSHMASEHLRLMQRCGFLKSVKQGRKVFYQIAEDHLAPLMQCIEARFDRAAS